MKSKNLSLLTASLFLVSLMWVLPDSHAQFRDSLRKVDKASACPVLGGHLNVALAAAKSTSICGNFLALLVESGPNKIILETKTGAGTQTMTLHRNVLEKLKESKKTKGDLYILLLDAGRDYAQIRVLNREYTDQDLAYVRSFGATAAKLADLQAGLKNGETFVIHMKPPSFSPVQHAEEEKEGAVFFTPKENLSGKFVRQTLMKTFFRNFLFDPSRIGEDSLLVLTPETKHTLAVDVVAGDYCVQISAPVASGGQSLSSTTCGENGSSGGLEVPENYNGMVLTRGACVEETSASSPAKGASAAAGGASASLAGETAGSSGQTARGAAGCDDAAGSPSGNTAAQVWTAAASGSNSIDSLVCDAAPSSGGLVSALAGRQGQVSSGRWTSSIRSEGRYFSVGVTRETLSRLASQGKTVEADLGTVNPDGTLNTMTVSITAAGALHILNGQIPIPETPTAPKKEDELPLEPLPQTTTTAEEDDPPLEPLPQTTTTAEADLDLEPVSPTIDDSVCNVGCAQVQQAGNLMTGMACAHGYRCDAGGFGGRDTPYVNPGLLGEGGSLPAGASPFVYHIRTAGSRPGSGTINPGDQDGSVVAGCGDSAGSISAGDAAEEGSTSTFCATSGRGADGEADQRCTGSGPSDPFGLLARFGFAVGPRTDDAGGAGVGGSGGDPRPHSPGDQGISPGGSNRRTNP